MMTLLTWAPSPQAAAATNLGRWMHQSQLSLAGLHALSVDQPEVYWARLLKVLRIDFATAPEAITKPAGTRPHQVHWLPGAELNIVASCFADRDPEGLALLRGDGDGQVQRWSRAELRRRAAAVAQGLKAAGYSRGDAIAIDLPMTADSIAIYLGIVWIGAVVVSIADSFQAAQIATRLRVSEAVLVFTQDQILRGARALPLYERVCAADAPKTIVLSATGKRAVALRSGDLDWDDFLAAGAAGEPAFSVGAADHPSNILFSSGTTGDPKAIPWTQITPIKAAADAWAHHDHQPGEVIAWPSNLGWMMGPWLIYASLLNGAAMAIFEGSPLSAAFARFVAAADVAMLGVVPSLVKAWRSSGALDGADWSAIRRFSSTGEASQPEDMAWLMERAGGVPVIEYCGGTELGGGYICGSMVQPQRPGCFSTAVMGCRFYLLDDDGSAGSAGEVGLVAPIFGASQQLLNSDHEAVYFAAMPAGPNGEVLRRHGDFIEALDDGFWRAHGRVDDTMNLGGIKISSGELERVVQTLAAVHECAAIATSPIGGGPSQLVLVVVLADGATEQGLIDAAQAAIRNQLNPLFKISTLITRDQLPRTASNKVMRRVLRAELT
jgi:acetyl-CoA synthetase